MVMWCHIKNHGCFLPKNISPSSLFGRYIINPNFNKLEKRPKQYKLLEKNEQDFALTRFYRYSK